MRIPKDVDRRSELMVITIPKLCRTIIVPKLWRSKTGAKFGMIIEASERFSYRSSCIVPNSFASAEKFLDVAFPISDIVILPNSDEVDRLGVAAHRSLSLRTLCLGLSSPLPIASFRSRAALRSGVDEIVLYRQGRNRCLKSGNRPKIRWLLSPLHPWRSDLALVAISPATALKSPSKLLTRSRGLPP